MHRLSGDCVYLSVVRHLMRYLLIFILLTTISVSYGQEVSYPSIISNGKTVMDFVPVGWAILDSAYGDLNKDDLNDAAIIIQHKDSIALVNGEDSILTQPRILIILFRNSGNNGFQLIEQSNSFILKDDKSAMEDPYQALTIARGVLEIKFQLFANMGSWYVTNTAYKFRYQLGQFFLIGADNSSFHRATHDYADYSYNFLTRKRVLIKGNDNKGSKKTSSKTLTYSVLKTLKTLKEPFTWEVEQDVYL
jgi:hypothetical protein